MTKERSKKSMTERKPFVFSKKIKDSNKENFFDQRYLVNAEDEDPEITRNLEDIENRIYLKNLLGINESKSNFYEI